MDLRRVASNLAGGRGHDVSRDAEAKFGSFAISLCHKYFEGQVEALFDEYWKEAHKNEAPGSVVVMKVPLNAGKGRIS